MMSPAILVFWQRYGLTALLGLTAVSCLGAIGFETGWGRAVRLTLPTANDATRTPDMLAALPGFALPSLENGFKETAERPLFTPTRRPPASNLAANVPAMKRGQFKLSGTSVNNELTVAFLLETATGKTVRVTKGKEINGMKLDAVEANRVVLKQGDETEELTLRTAASPPPSANVAARAPVTAPAAPGVPVAVQPVAVVTVGAPPQPVARPATQPPNALAPAQGSAVLPGFTQPAAPASPQSQAAPPADTGNTAQRRRRIQNPPQQ